MSYEFPALLRAYSLKALQTMAKFAGLGPELAGQAALAESTEPEGVEFYVQTLAQTFVQPEKINAALSRLDGLEKLVLAQILRQGGEMRTDLLRQELLQSGFVQDTPSRTYQGSPYRRAPRYLEDVLARLTALGLVLSVEGEPRNGSTPPLELSPGPRLVVPPAIREHLGILRHWATPVPDEAIGTVWQAAPEAFQRDLFLFWSYVNRNEVSLTSRGWLPKRHWLQLNEEMWVKEDVPNARHEGETGRLHFIRLLMEEMGLIERHGLRLQIAPGSRDFLGLSLRARTERAFRAWLRLTPWNELLRIRELRIDTSTNRDTRATSVIKGGRQFVAGLLQHTPPQQWVLLADFLKRAKDVNYEFLFPRHHNYYGLHNPYHSYNNPLSWQFPVYDEAQGWDIVEARFIRYVLQEPLHWLGIVSLGWNGPDLVALEVSSIGAQILGIIPLEPEQTLERRLVMQPNFEILAFDPVSDYTLSVLDEFAERVKGERVFQYRLTRESVYQAQQKGMTVQQIIEFLNRESSSPMPQNVALTLQEWGRYHDRIAFFHGGILCQVASPELLDRLLTDPNVGPQLGRRISPTATLLSDGDARLQQLQRALQSSGYLPTVTSEPDQNVACLKVEEDGHIRFAHLVPDIYLRYRLLPFTELHDGELYLTSAAVERAAALGWTAERIIGALRPLHIGPLSADVVSRIKVWAKYYGNAALKRVTLLQLKNSDVLRELLEDPLVGPLIVPLVPSAALAIVRDDDVELLRQALMEKGIGLDASLRQA